MMFLKPFGVTMALVVATRAASDSGLPDSPGLPAAHPFGAPPSMRLDSSNGPLPPISKGPLPPVPPSTRRPAQAKPQQSNAVPKVHVPPVQVPDCPSPKDLPTPSAEAGAAAPEIDPTTPMVHPLPSAGAMDPLPYVDKTPDAHDFYQKLRLRVNKNNKDCDDKFYLVLEAPSDSRPNVKCIPFSENRFRAFRQTCNNNRRYFDETYAVDIPKAELIDVEKDEFQNVLATKAKMYDQCDYNIMVDDSSNASISKYRNAFMKLHGAEMQKWFIDGDIYFRDEKELVPWFEKQTGYQHKVNSALRHDGKLDKTGNWEAKDLNKAEEREFQRKKFYFENIDAIDRWNGRQEDSSEEKEDSDEKDKKVKNKKGPYPDEHELVPHVPGSEIGFQHKVNSVMRETNDSNVVKCGWGFSDLNLAEQRELKRKRAKYYKAGKNGFEKASRVPRQAESTSVNKIKSEFEQMYKKMMNKD